MSAQTRPTIYAGFVIALIIVAAIAYFVGTSQVKTVTTTVTTTVGGATKTVTVTQTVAGGPGATAAAIQAKINKQVERDVVSLAQKLVAAGIHEVKYTVWGAGDPNSVMRVYAIVEAAHRLNKMLEKHGVDLKIVVEPRFERGGGNELLNEFLAAYQQGANPDIMANSYVHLARLASEGLILDLTPYLQEYSFVLDDYYKPLLDAVTWKGKYYALPQDTEARPLYWRMDVAACIKEKAGVDILADLAKKVEEGKVTWHDVYKFAKLAKETGCAEWGVIHRKGTAHPDLIQFIYAFGGKLYDPATGKLVVDVPAVYKWLYVEWKMARDGLIPADMMSWDWAKQIHPTVVDGKTLVFIGGTWHWTEWQTKPYHTDPKTGQKRPLTAKEVEKYFYYTLFPAGDPGNKPVTLSQPFAWYVATNAGKDNPKYDQLKDVYHKLAFLLVLKANDPDLVAIHSIISSHLPITKTATDLLYDNTFIEKLKTLNLDLDPKVKEAIEPIVEKTVNPINIMFLAKAAKMLEYTHLTPKHPYYMKLASIFADAVAKVLRGEMTPKQAIDYIKSKVIADPDLKNSVEFIGNIPSNWKFP